MFFRPYAGSLKTIEDAVFVYYGCPNQHWQDKCQKCRNEILDPVSHTAKPIKECINCWKIEIWAASVFPAESHVFQALEGFLMRLLCAIRDVDWPYEFCAKISKEPIQVVRTGIPLDAYPSRNLDYLLMLYAETIREKDFLLSAIRRVLGEPGGPGSPGFDDFSSSLAEPSISSRIAHPSQGKPHSIIIPSRRGCWLYDDILGPWTTWYPLDSDYPHS